MGRRLWVVLSAVMVRTNLLSTVMVRANLLSTVMVRATGTLC